MVYFSALFPYVILLILLVRGLTLDGAWDGIKYLFIPRLEKLLDGEVNQKSQLNVILVFLIEHFIKI